MIYLLLLIIALVCSLHFEYAANMSNNRRYTLAPTASLIWCMLLLMFIAVGGFRDVSIGGDTMQYFRAFRKTPSLPDMSMNFLDSSRYQWLFNFFLSVIKFITDDFVIVQICHVSIVNIIIFWFFKSQAPKVAFMCLVFYLILNYIEFNTEIMRESIAVCLGLISFVSFKKKKFLLSLGLALLAFGFHLSAVVLILFPLISRIKYSKFTIRAFIAIGVCLMVIFPMVSTYTDLIQEFLSDQSENVGNLYKNYDSTEIDSSFNLNYFLLLFFKTLLFPAIGLSLLKEKSNRYIGFVLFYSILMLMSAYTYGFYRFGNYLAPFYIIFLSNYCYAIIKRFRDPKPNRIVLASVFVILVLYMFQGYQLKKAPDGSLLYERYVPYKTIVYNYF